MGYSLWTSLPKTNLCRGRGFGVQGIIWSDALKKIKIKCESKTVLPLDELNEFQGELKSLSTKDAMAFKDVLVKNGFKFPFDVWENPEDNKFYILNGHQRKRVLELLRYDGFEIPLLPVSYVYADSYKEAKESVLEAATQWGKIERDGLYEFINTSDIDVSEIENFRFEEIDMDSFKQEYFEEFKEEPSEPEIDPEIPWAKEVDEKNDYIVLFFDKKEDFNAAQEKLRLGQIKHNISASGVTHGGFLRTGICRVIEGKNVIDKLQNL